jgi:hypothetical protein
MVDKAFIAYFKLAHGFFNSSMFALFCWQAWLGYRIRQARRAGAPLPFDTVKRHRRFGPVFALWGVLGFVAGVVMVLLDKGRMLEFPLHFLAGSAIVIVIVLLYAVSRRIKGAEPVYRNIHFGLGICLIALYVVQLLLGIGILL